MNQLQNMGMSRLEDPWPRVGAHVDILAAACALRGGAGGPARTGTSELALAEWERLVPGDEPNDPPVTERNLK